MVLIRTPTTATDRDSAERSIHSRHTLSYTRYHTGAIQRRTSGCRIAVVGATVTSQIHSGLHSIHSLIRLIKQRTATGV